MTERSCSTCLHQVIISAGPQPCDTCENPELTNWQAGVFTHPVVGKVHVHPTPGVASDFETHPAGTMRRIAQLEQEVAACERRLADMAREMQKFMDEAQQRR